MNTDRTRKRGNHSQTIDSEKDKMVRDILKSSISPILLNLKEKYSISVSEPYLIGEDKVGLIFCAEGRIPLFWDSPIPDIHKRIKEVPNLMAKQPLISGRNGIPEDDQDEENDDSLTRTYLFAEALAQVSD